MIPAIYRKSLGSFYFASAVGTEFFVSDGVVFCSATVDKNDTASNGFIWFHSRMETISQKVKPSVILGSHKGYQIVPFLLADFHHIFHPVEETLIKINNECHFGIILCRSVGIVLCDLFFV